ncbi:OTU domain-containing protein [Kibdelosporangium philippinense]|uniref:OTU domain-containing protein n=1 Tax=Kibdelosporangium philippinense TaxID=211113 RepID=UPI0036081F78
MKISVNIGRRLHNLKNKPTARVGREEWDALGGNGYQWLLDMGGRPLPDAAEPAKKNPTDAQLAQALRDVLVENKAHEVPAWDGKSWRPLIHSRAWREIDNVRVNIGQRLQNLKKKPTARVGREERKALGGNGYGWLLGLIDAGLTRGQADRLVADGLVPVDVDRDGDCFMHALVRTAGLRDADGRPLSAVQMRKDLAAELRQDLTRQLADRQLWTAEFELTARTMMRVDQGRSITEELTSQDRDQLIGWVATSGVYANAAGDITPIVAAKVYGVNIHIYHSNGLPPQEVGNDRPDTRVVRLVRLDVRSNGVDHWMATAPVPVSTRSKRPQPAVLDARDTKRARTSQQHVAPGLDDVGSRDSIRHTTGR